MTVPAEESADDLRTAFAAWEGSLPAAGQCPSAEDIWSAVARELSHDVIRSMILHVSACGSCAEAWRLAHGALVELSAEDPANQQTTAWRSPWVWAPGLAAAALVIIGIAVDRGAELLPHSAPPSFRQTTSDTGIRSVISDDATVSREAPVIRWTEAAAGSRYDVRVFTEDLSSIAFGTGLEKPEFTIPPDTVSSLPRGTRLLWQVDVVARDGSRRPSATFRLRVQ